MTAAEPYARGRDAGLNGIAPALFCPLRQRVPYWLGYLIGRRRLRSCVALTAQTIADMPISIHRKDEPR